MQAPVLTHAGVVIFHCYKDPYEAPRALLYWYRAGAVGDECSGFDVRTLRGYDPSVSRRRGREHHAEVIRGAIDAGIDLSALEG